MPAAYLTRTVQFSAAHRYFRPEWSEAKNAEVFGRCAAPHGHGHTYQCMVTVRGEVDGSTGMVVNLAALDQVDETFLITTLEVPALRQARKLLGALSARGYNASRIRLVINRMPKRPDVTPSELESMLGTPIYAHIPNDYHALYEAYIAGQLVAPDSQVVKATAALTCRMAGLEPAGQKRRFALFG